MRLSRVITICVSSMPVLWIALFLASAHAAAGEKVDRVVIGESFTIDSKALHETRRINVYRPPSSTASDTRLPVLYLLDGGLAEDFLHIAGLVQVSVGNGTIRPILLVGIENTERRRDMTGTTDNAEDKKIAPRVGGSTAFRTFLREELMSEVKKRYRTTPEAALIGESLAGLFVVETLLLEPDLFDTYIAVDASLWWNHHKLVLDAGGLLRTRPKLEKTLYLAWSAEEMVPGVSQLFVDALAHNAPAGLRWRSVKMAGEKHATIFHPAALQSFREVLQPMRK
jgi:uncharacterized protein